LHREAVGAPMARTRLVQRLITMNSYQFLPGMEPSVFLAVFPYAFLASFPIAGIIFVTKWSLEDRKRKNKRKQAVTQL
jgi:hypothetical protein